MNSILTSVKKILGITEEYIHFDKDLIMHINTVFLSTRLLGIGPPSGVMVVDELDTWESVFGDVIKTLDLSAVKTYIALRVRLLFDPPASQAHITSIQNEINKLEWQLNVQVETPIKIEKE